MSSDSSASSPLEYYIRGQHDTEARGPFTTEQLASLTESSDPAKSVTPETFYYDNSTEQWATIGSHADLKATLWPEKKSLRADTVDFQRGELEAGGKHLYFGQFSYDLTVREVPPDLVE